MTPVRPLLHLLLVFIAFAPQAKAHDASRAPVAAEHAMVVTAQHLATRIGVSVLKRGGNAIDAAVAVGYALAVVYPAAGNLGGGGFMTIQLADGRRTFIDFRERAPLAATRDMYLDARGEVIGDSSTRGHLAVAVPGTVAGLELARGKYGTMNRGALIAPSIRLAEEGFTLEAADARLLASAAADFRKDAPSAAIFLSGGKPLAAGERLTQRDLARTLRLVSERGAEGFYKGPVAAALVASSKAGGGILTQPDLDAYRVREMAPLECDYRGHHLVSAPPPSSGGTIVCEILHILEGYPLKAMGPRSVEAFHYRIEAMRRGFVDRTSLGDPAFVENPLARLLDTAYARQVRESIDPAKAARSRELRAGVAPHEGANTTHYSIVDKDGNAVAVTYTLNDSFGARVTAAGTGVLLNNEMDDFTVKLGVANLYGLVQGEPNTIAPGKTPLSSMSPTIVLRDGKPRMVLGTPGGSRIITAVVQTIVNVIDYGMDIQQAVDAPRFHQQWLPEETFYEPRAIDPAARERLEAMGHQLRAIRASGHMAAILIGDGRLYGANDSRGGSGLALGY